MSKDTRESPFDYKHNVETCACGTCYRARVDSGTQAKYEADVRARVEAFVKMDIASHTSTSPAAQLQEALKKRQENPKKSEVATKAGNDLAKEIFSAMGTPFDSTCPHKLPFYSCMSCSH